MLGSLSATLQSPIAIPLPSPGLLDLPAEINSSTRSLHTELNRLIIARLPLAIPPYAHDPTIYAAGIEAFAQIYINLELAYTDLITSLLHSDPDASPDDAQHQHVQAVRTCLSTLIPPGLWRTKRLQSDLETLNRGHNVTVDHGYDHDCGKALLDLTTRIRSTAAIKPHVLVAYSWVMYMAIFSGGRWIRQQLRSAGPDFWIPAPDTTSTDDIDFTTDKPSSLGYSLFEFDGSLDGEDIKTDFKVRLGAVERLFTDSERRDVVLEAQALFRGCIDVVTELDRSTAGSVAVVDGIAGREGNETWLWRTGRIPRIDSSGGIANPLIAILAVCVGCVSLYGLRLIGIL